MSRSTGRLLVFGQALLDALIARKKSSDFALEAADLEPRVGFDGLGQQGAVRLAVFLGVCWT
ncbi:MAG: hypothetical protein QM755_21360 [Luteolibacter sp.]